MTPPLLFAYGSLVGVESATRTHGEPLEPITPARLRGHRRTWSTVRDNLAAEKTFAPDADGEPFSHCLGLNLEPEGEGPGPNGALLRLSEAQLERLDLRELRYERIEVTGQVDPSPPGERVEAYVARRRHHHPEPPAGAVVLASYVAAVEAAFAELGPGELELFRATTAPPPVEVVEAVLIAERIPPGNPRAW